MVQFDWALFLVRCGMLLSSPSADAALESLSYLTAHPGPLERPAAGQELCISPPADNDPHWTDVLERYLQQFPLLPRVLTRTKLGDVPLHRCSLYLLFEPASHARQVFLRIQFLSTNGNWNPTAWFAVMINARSHTREIFNQFENFDLLGLRHGLVLMSVPEHNRTFTMMADCSQRTLDYVMEVDDVPELLANYSALGLHGQSIAVARKAEFPFLIKDRYTVDGVYCKFFHAFAHKYKGRLVFRDSNVQIVLTIHNRETLTKPYAIGSFTGNCLIVPEKPKQGLIHYLLSPFSSPVWYLCCCVIAGTFLLNWYWAARFPNNILLTVLFGDQAGDGRYSLSERRLIFVAIVIMFFFSEAYSAKLLSTFIESLNQPRIRTIQALGSSDIPIGVLHYEDIEAYEQLHQNLHVLDEPEYYRNMRHGRNAFLLQCGNAEYLLHREMREPDGVFEVPYYILDEFVGWRMNGFSVSKFSSFTVELTEFIGLIGQAGLWEYWREQYIQRLRNIASRELTERETLELGDLISLQYVLTVGYGSATVVFGVELLMGYVRASVSQVQSGDSLSNSVLRTLRYIITQSERIEPPAARQEVCISPPPKDHHWNDVLQDYLHQFPQYPRILTSNEHTDVKLPKCSLYLLFHPNAVARQIFLLLKSFSSNTNWNSPVNVILMTNWIGRPDQFKIIFKVFYTMGMHNVIHLVANGHANDSAIVSTIHRGTIHSFRPGTPGYSKLLEDRTKNLHQLSIVIEKKVVYPFLMYNLDKISGVYYQFFEAFAKHINARITFNTTNNQILLGVRPTNALSVPLAVGGFTGNCLVVPEKPKAGLIHYLLFPFKPSLCILLTILFGDQGSPDSYVRTERRLIFVAVLIMFFLSEAYSAKLMSMFIRSLNEPHLQTIAQFAASGITLELPVHADRALLTAELQSNLLISEKHTYVANVQLGRHAILLDCGNARHLVHEIMNEHENQFPVRYNILPEFVGWRMNGLSVSKFSPVRLRLTQFAGHIAQAGLWDYWNGLYLKRMDSLLSRSTSYRGTFTMRDLISLHYLLLAGHDQLQQFVGQAGLSNNRQAIYIRKLDGIVHRTIMVRETVNWTELASLLHRH
uniref:Ionotropic glutamate receptor L-glutamate and glycine-binding domain-containing protein n=1 Tax=Anopheles christyi TaxID=43041 RepID=A0A182K9H4_9DIPT